MKVIEVIENKENFKLIEKKINKTEKKLSNVEKQGKGIIYKIYLYITILMIALLFSGYISILSIILISLPFNLFSLFDTIGLFDKFLLYLNEKPTNKNYNIFLNAMYNLKGVNSLFYISSLEKRFKKDLKNKEIRKCLKTIKNTYKRKRYNKDLYKEILKDSIEENMILEIEENKNSILKEISTFKEKDKKELQGVLIERIGLDNILESNQEKEDDIIIKKEEVLKNI